MDNNNPTSWPPEPQTGANGTPKKPVNSIAGWISLIMALAGVVFLIAPLVMPGRPVPELPLMVIELIWWCATIVLGIVGRRSLPGKIGLGICLAFFVLMAIITVWLVAQHAAAPVRAPTVPSLPPLK
jgi:hypothetical protein